MNKTPKDEEQLHDQAEELRKETAEGAPEVAEHDRRDVGRFELRGIEGHQAQLLAHEEGEVTGDDDSVSFRIRVTPFVGELCVEVSLDPGGLGRERYRDQSRQ